MSAKLSDLAMSRLAFALPSDIMVQYKNIILRVYHSKFTVKPVVLA